MAFSGKTNLDFHGWAISQKIAVKGQKETVVDNLGFMTKDHYRELYEIHLRSGEPLIEGFDKFVETMELNPGFTMFNNGKVVGCINFGDHMPGHYILMHLTMDVDDDAEWSLSPREYRLVFGYCFDALQVRRVTGACIPGIGDKKERFLQKLGFCHEGTLREMAKLPDGNYQDIKLYGLLRKEQKGDTSCH